jgi:hypothetical protein
MKLIIVLLGLIFVLTSCSSFIKRIDLQQNNFVTIPQTNKNFCSSKASFLLMNSEKLSQQEFEKTIKGKDFSPVEKFVLWSLVQMIIRPDVNSPESQFEIFVNGPKSNRYFRFTLEQYQYPMIEGLSLILKAYSAKRNLKELIYFLEASYPKLVNVDSELENFIEINKDSIKAINELKEVFIRADETLKNGEKFNRLSIEKLVNLIPKNEIQITPLPLLNHESSRIPLSCNFSMQSYDDSLYSVQEKVNPNYTFGIMTDDFNFLAASSLNYKNISLIPGTIWFSADKSNKKARFDIAACSYEDQNTNKQIILISTASRDPGQHLYHLFQYDMEKIKGAKELEGLLKFARHLFLTDPLRLIYESHRGTEKQLTELLKLNIPIYNANGLGHITGFIQIQDDKNFVLDNRHKAFLSCP